MTVRSVLFGHAEPGQVAVESPGWAALLDRLGSALGAGIAGAGLQLVTGQLSAQLGALVNVDLGGILVDGWRRRAELAAAAEMTSRSPRATAEVPLVDHRILTSQQPSIDVVVNGTPVATLTFDLGIMIDVEGVSATVRHGRLVALRGGRCTAGLGLGFAGHEIAARKTLLDPTVVNLGHGIALLRDAQGQSAR
jgi:hypothetical protein